ncbi:hypothetical protein D3C80_1985110 [compost metagenome]
MGGEHGCPEGAAVVKAVDQSQLVIDPRCAKLLRIPHGILVKRGALLNMVRRIIQVLGLLQLLPGFEDAIEGDAQRIIPLAI